MRNGLLCRQNRSWAKRGPVSHGYGFQGFYERSSSKQRENKISSDAWPKNGTAEMIHKKTYGKALKSFVAANEKTFEQNS